MTITLQPAQRQAVQVGDVALTFIPDGHLLFRPEQVFPGFTDNDRDHYAELIDSDGFVVMSSGGWLIQSAGRTALVDLGLGPRVIDVTSLSAGRLDGVMAGGRLIENLAAAGVDASDVDLVLITHLHVEHVGWLLGAGPGSVFTFPNAHHCVGKAELDYWNSTEPRQRRIGPSDEQLNALTNAAGLLVDGDEPLPGITTLATPGHTPGHLSFSISSHDESAIIVGDVVHSPIELSNPELTFAGDIDPRLARQTREGLIARLRAPQMIMAAVHFPSRVFTRLDTRSEKPCASWPVR